MKFIYMIYPKNQHHESYFKDNKSPPLQVQVNLKVLILTLQFQFRVFQTFALADLNFVLGLHFFCAYGNGKGFLNH